MVFSFVTHSLFCEFYYYLYNLVQFLGVSQNSREFSFFFILHTLGGVMSDGSFIYLYSFIFSMTYPSLSYLYLGCSTHISLISSATLLYLFLVGLTLIFSWGQLVICYFTIVFIGGIHE